MSVHAASSFEAKWALAHPELPLTLHFAAAPMRPVISALACLAYEIGHAAWHIVEPEVARSKLQWWDGELSALAAGRPRHPLTTTLSTWPSMAAMTADAWSAVITGALAQREMLPAASLDALLGGYRRLHGPLAIIEATLHPKLDVEASTQAANLMRALHEATWTSEALARDRLPLPLDLLARHQLSRADLGQPGARRDAALREHFAQLASHMRALDRRGLAALTAAALQAAAIRSQRAARAADPLAESASKLDRLPFSSVWAGWRSARRMQASP